MSVVSLAGGLFTKDQTEQELMFRLAVDRINADSTILSRTTLVAQVEKIEELDSFHADKRGSPNVWLIERQTHNTTLRTLHNTHNEYVQQFYWRCVKPSLNRWTHRFQLYSPLFTGSPLKHCFAVSRGQPSITSITYPSVASNSTQQTYFHDKSVLYHKKINTFYQPRSRSTIRSVSLSLWQSLSPSLSL